MSETSTILDSGSKKVISRSEGKWIVNHNGFAYPANFVVVNEASHVYGNQITTYGKVTVYQ